VITTAQAEPQFIVGMSAPTSMGCRGVGDQGRGRAFQDREESGPDFMLKGVNIVNFLMN
jgi:hypothetical protein